MIAIDKDVGRTIAICVMSGIFPGAIAFFSLPPFKFVLRNITYLSLLGSCCAFIFMVAAWYFETLKVGKMQKNMEKLQEKIDHLEGKIKDQDNKGMVSGMPMKTKPIFVNVNVNEEINKEKGSIDNAPAKHI